MRLEDHVHFIHMRVYAEDDVEQTNPLAKEGATIAWREIPSESEDTCLVHVAISRCHVNDHYCRKIGRDVALGRLLNDECFPLLIDVDQLDAVHDLIVAFANERMAEWEEQHQRVLEERAAAKEAKHATKH